MNMRLQTATVSLPPLFHSGPTSMAAESDTSLETLTPGPRPLSHPIWAGAASASPNRSREFEIRRAFKGDF
jgi:hypothetical protein